MIDDTMTSVHEASRTEHELAVARSREAAEALWLEVCRSVRAGNERRPAFAIARAA
jgi:hypothetical protein